MNNTQISDQIKDRIAYWLALSLGKLSLPIAQHLGSLLGRLLWVLPTPTRGVIRTNIRACFPELDTRSQNQLIKQSLINAVITACEAGPIWQKPIEHGQAFIAEVSGEHLLDQALKDPRGLILMLPHLGNWEMTNQYICKKTPVVALYKPLKIPSLETLILRARTRAGASMVPANRRGVKALFQTLRQGGTTIILPDQEPDADKGKGYFSPFFNIPAFTSAIVPRLARETNAQVLVIFCKRLPTGQFGVCLRPAHPDIANQNLSIATRAVNQSIEQAVRECPEQYQWNYKRFKRRPPSESSSDTHRFYR